MKKFLALFCLFLTGVSIWAQSCNNCQISINGVAMNGATINGDGTVDVSAVADGDTICFDVMLNNFEFDLAGYQFELNYPAILTKLSETVADWTGATGAVVTAGDFINAFPLQQLPADSVGALTAATALENAEGKKPVGVLLTDPSNRPTGTAGTPNAGGAVLRLCVQWNPGVASVNGGVPLATCTSRNESIVIPITGTFADASDDIFANSAAERVSLSGAQGVVLGEVALDFGDSGAVHIRADHDGINGRGALDALPAAICALNFGSQGQAGCGVALNGGAPDWPNVAADEFIQAFDYNCDGVVGALDALPLAKLCLGLQNRSTQKRIDYQSLDRDGLVTLNYGEAKGAMGSATFNTRDIRINSVYISEAAKNEGWVLLHEYTGDAMQYIVMNPHDVRDAAIPSVHVEYEAVGNRPALAMADSVNQTADLAAFSFAPSIGFDRGDKVESRDRDAIRK